ncbi:MAG: VCBS repeat-containing protein [Sphingomicrobium sp.]
MPYLLTTTITYTAALNTYIHEYAMLDVDGDGDQDIVCAQFGPPAEFAGNPIQILLNNGSGGFTDGTSIIFPSGAPLTFHPRGIAIADYNGDGRPDLFIADHGYDDVPYVGAQNTLLLSSGVNGFVDATDRLPQVSDYSHSTTAGDIDGDGDIDILVMNTNGGTPPSGSLTDSYILINDGTGNFVRHDDLLPTSVATRAFGSKYTSCLFFDADGDGDQDLFLGAHGGESSTNFSRILYNDGTGNFSAAVSVDLPTGPWSPLTAGAVAVTTADLNGDGWLDLIVDLENAYQAHYIQLLINDGAGGFVDETPDRLPQSTADDGRWIHSVQAVDLNGDGYVDLIARNGQYPPIFLNDGTGHFVNLPASFLDYGGRGGGYAVVRCRQSDRREWRWPNGSVCRLRQRRDASLYTAGPRPVANRNGKRRCPSRR